MMYTDKELSKIKEELRDDTKYYGDFGKKFLSNSDIRTLLSNPKNYGQSLDTTKAMIQGRYFHTAMLEPNKIPSYPIIDVASRNTNKYRDELEGSSVDMLLLNKEAVECMDWVSAMKSNIRFFDDIYDTNNQYEVPGLQKIRGHWWKGKADIITDDAIIDIKTTGDIHKFERSAKIYNYDSQSYIYQQIFGKPMVFYVIDKTTHCLGIFAATDSFIQGGRDKVMRALDNYEKFWGDDATDDPEHFIIETQLI